MSAGLERPGGASARLPPALLSHEGHDRAPPGARRRARIRITHLPRLLQKDREAAAGSDLALGDDDAVHRLDQLARDGEPEAEAAGLARSRAVSPVEAVEDVRQLVFRDADPRVLD